MGVRVSQKNKNVKTENVPLSYGYMDQVEKKSLKDCILLINIQPALCRLKSLTPLSKAKKKDILKPKDCLIRHPEKPRNSQ